MTGTRTERRKGQPVLVFGMVIVLWVAVRVSLWEPQAVPAGPGSLPVIAESRQGVSDGMPAQSAGAGTQIAHPELSPNRDFEPPPLSAPPPTIFEPFEGWPAVRPTDPAESVAPAPALQPHAAGVAGHAALWMAAMAYVPLPPEAQAAMVRTGPRRPASATPADRWSLDGWLFLRSGERSLAAGGPNAPSYGGSQVGAVLQFRLAPSSRFDPKAYARSATARGGKEADVAAGLSARPVGGLPVRAHAELRVSRSDERVELRPAAFVTAGFDRENLPLGLTARGYGQAGYVGGTHATAFADGSLVVERPLATFDLGKLGIGAGAWGGAQKGAQRVDIGPSASFALMIGDAPARLSADYRLRVAGDAEPKNGAALTLSTSF